MNTVRMKIQLLLNHEPFGQAQFYHLTMIPGYSDGIRVYNVKHPQDEFDIRFNMLGKYWGNWYLIRTDLRDFTGMFIGSETAPVYLKETDHPTALFHYYVPGMERKGIPDIEPKTFTVSMMVPRNENRV